MDCDVATLLAMTGVGSMRLSEQLGWLDCDVAALLAMTGWVAALVGITWMDGLRRRCSPRNDGSGVDALVRTTWMAGLRRRYSPRNDGRGTGLLVSAK